MHFAKLKLSGFKSFVDPVELVIDPGITGIVGPNGCGKSNVIEALRWVMGETSAKRMRGTEMDDVIFGGSSQRPARNLAEVALLLDNQAKDAPAPYDTLEEVEITRRIERGSGSNYRINGKDARARDVQLLFADASTGSRSPALVRQGQINEIIAAKPQNRRRILEEAAGITGLHTRRHEAELKLNGAENNLSRVDDVIEQLEGRLAQLARQAKQAARYREIAAELRRAEATFLYIRWREADVARLAADTALTEAVAAAATAEREASAAARASSQSQAS